MQSEQVQQLLPVLKTMEHSEQQMLIGIIQTLTSKVRVILPVFSVKVDIQVGGPSLYLHQLLTDHSGSITE